MSLSSAKAKLDAQGGDPATGYISKQDHKDSYDQLVDDTALTGATTAEAITVSGAAVAATINGRDPDDLVLGPASATDNALVRFDGVGGKTVQNSGITVDDSNNITSDLTVSKAAPAITASGSGAASVGATSSSGGYAQLSLDRAAGQFGITYCKTAGSIRWAYGANNTAESGANAGSNFFLYSFTDAGAYANQDLLINRATGKWTFGSVGATAGLELGASGPRVMSGTGSPEGVVTAPVGSTWIDTAATTGAIQWIKATGTGNTGWVVQYGDTGWRNITSSHAPSSNSWAASLQRIRRVGAAIQYVASFENTSGTTVTGAVTGVTLPSGMRTALNQQFYVATNSSSVGRLAIVESTGAINLWGYSTVTSFQLSLSWATSDAWPASLPGSAA